MLKKRMLVFLLSLAMLLTLIPVMSFAEDVTDDNTSQNGTVEMTEEDVSADSSSEEREEDVETIESEEATVIDSGEDNLTSKETVEGMPEEDVVKDKYNYLSPLIPQKEGKCSLNLATWEALTEFTYDGHSIVYALAYAEDDGSDEVWSQGDEIAFEIYHVKKGVVNEYEKTLSISLGAETWYWIIADNGTNGISAREDYAILKEGETYEIRVRNKTSHHHEIGYLLKSYDAISNEGSLPAKVDLDTAAIERFT